MKEYIEKIIEIILDNVSCEHPEIDEYPRGAKSNDPTYSLENENAVIEECIKAIPARLIERPEITVEWMKKKTRQLSGMSLISCKGVSLRSTISIKEAEIFLSSLLNELSAKINLIGAEKITVTEEFINEQVKGMEQLFLNCDGGFNRFMLNMPRQLQAILKKLNIEIKEK